LDAVKNGGTVKRSADQVVLHSVVLAERAKVRIGKTIGVTRDRSPMISGGKVALR
jgi:hypothetical protein